MSIEILEVYVFTLKLPDTRLHKFFDILNRFQCGKKQVFILLLRWTVCKTLTKQPQRYKTATSKLVSKKELNLKSIFNSLPWSLVFHKLKGVQETRPNTGTVVVYFDQCLGAAHSVRCVSTRY